MKILMAFLIASFPALALAADQQNPDHTFYTQAAEANLSEIETGKLAQKRATDPAVKQFGAMMVKDHTQATDKLKSLAKKKDVSLPDDLSTAKKSSMKTLEMQSAADFDRAYIKSQIDAHQDTIALLKKEAKSGQDNDAKALATSLIPTVQGHLEQAQQLEKTLASNHTNTPNKMVDKSSNTGATRDADQ